MKRTIIAFVLVAIVVTAVGFTVEKVAYNDKVSATEFKALYYNHPPINADDCKPAYGKLSRAKKIQIKQCYDPDSYFPYTSPPGPEYIPEGWTWSFVIKVRPVIKKGK